MCLINGFYIRHAECQSNELSIFSYIEISFGMPNRILDELILYLRDGSLFLFLSNFHTKYMAVRRAERCVIIFIFL